ncbi:hypothetical protein DFJ73DRAFT_810300 [Zopfochytrium polystomum]|nr:hypothetical protein DFJ73DRAFT_810300 [Zopfochytrium polystomum]
MWRRVLHYSGALWSRARPVHAGLVGAGAAAVATAIFVESANGIDRTASVDAALSSVGNASLSQLLMPPSAIEAIEAASRTRVVECEEMEEPKRSWTDVQLGEYENKLRAFSHPQKVFNYFASQKHGGTHYMTIYDLLRSLIPYRSFYEISRSSSGNMRQRVPSAEEFFSMADANGDGLISFSEYVTFLTLLGVPAENWRVTFKIIDADDSGLVSKSEFEQLIRYHVDSLSSVGRMGSVEKEKALDFSHSGVFAHFFGSDGKKQLTFEEFAKFMKRLNREILNLEFHEFVTDENGTISLKDFGKSVVAHVPQRHLSEALKRLKTLPASEARVTFEEFAQYDKMIREHSQQIAIAYKSFPSIHRGQWTKQEFKSVMRRLTDVSLSDAQVDVIFHLFDKNDDGHLDEREFYEYGVKGRYNRGLVSAQPSNPFSLKRVWACVTQT